MNIVSLLPSATEIVFALGRGDDLVGVTFECDHPPEARQRAIVSTSALPEGLSPAQIDALVSERIAAGEDLYRLDEGALSGLDVDVVLTQDLCAVCAVDVERVDDALAHLGCSAQVVTLDPRSLDEIFGTIEQVAAALGVPGAGGELVAGLRRRIASLEERLAGARQRPVLALEWTDPPFSAGHWLPDLLAAGGGTPVLAHPGADSQRLAWEAVKAAPAEAVVVTPCGYHLDRSVALAEELVAADRLPGGAEVWAVDADAYFVRPGPRVVDGAELVSHLLHPDRCGEPPADRARRVA